MSYVPNIWKHGEVITKEKLNHIEQGLVDASKSNEEVYVIHASAEWNSETQTYVNVVIDKPVSEVFDLVGDNKIVLVALKEASTSYDKWLVLSYSTDSCLRFAVQEVNDTTDPDVRYSADIYTLELRR